MEAVNCDNPDIGDIALLISAEDFPGLDIEAYSTQLVELGNILLNMIIDHNIYLKVPEDIYIYDNLIVELMRDCIGKNVPLRGAGGGNPKTHYLHSVIEHGMGVPLACGLVWLAVAKKAKINAEGVGLPGHFLIRIGRHLVDTYSGGNLLSNDDVKALVRKPCNSNHIELDPAWLLGSSPRYMMARLSRNLRGCYAMHENWTMALQCADRCVDLLPEEASDIRDRGLIYWKSGRSQEAVSDLERYCQLNPTGHDIKDLQNMIRKIQNR